MVESQFRVVMEEQNSEIRRLRKATEKIQELEIDQSTDNSVYWKEIVRILKQYVLDKNLRLKL